MVSTIEEIIGKPAKINRLPMQPGDVDVTYADVTKAKNMIGYHPVMAFDRGIRNFIAWYKEINNI
jgi:UDP-glucuronate 4-epimerase